MTGQAGQDREWLREAIELSRRCPVTETAYAVGAIIVVVPGYELASQKLSWGYSRETDSHIHAEESALAKLAGADLSGATIYTTMEPCTTRKSRPLTCTQLILAAGISRVVFALREPPLFADCQGVETLRAAGVDVVEIPELAEQVREINAQVLRSARNQ